MTRIEEVIWQAVRAGRLDGWKFKRQIPFGPYVADSFCPEAKLVIEVDGPDHRDPERKERDVRHDAWFDARGFRVVRIPGDLILGSPALAIERISTALKAAAPSPGLLSEGHLLPPGERVWGAARER